MKFEKYHIKCKFNIRNTSVGFENTEYSNGGFALVIELL